MNPIIQLIISRIEAKEGAGGPTLTKLTFARKIESRQPVDEVDQAPADNERVYAYVELENQGAEQSIALEWTRADKVRYRHSLRVGRSKTWRTWGYIRARKHAVGEWTVTVRDAQGTELGSKNLVIE